MNSKLNLQSNKRKSYKMMQTSTPSATNNIAGNSQITRILKKAFSSDESSNSSIDSDSLFQPKPKKICAEFKSSFKMTETVPRQNKKQKSVKKPQRAVVDNNISIAGTSTGADLNSFSSKNLTNVFIVKMQEKIKEILKKHPEISNAGEMQNDSKKSLEKCQKSIKGNIEAAMKHQENINFLQQNIFEEQKMFDMCIEKADIE